ncbi:MAG: gliding motility-associated C-terminal domain-containing protein, partial [Bacteroidetes bacterium]|nr:gliding motility-associated C-terminal domain-containing protein [Bacteroidota bacterium]
VLRPTEAEITTSNGFFATPKINCDFQLNKTYHVAMVYDGATLKLYRNGYLMSQVAATGNLFQNDWITTIGDYAPAFAATSPENMNGYINEVRIWNVARSQAQIQAYMGTTLPSPSSQPGLLAYYNFTSLANQQGNATWNGKLTGAASINNINPNCIFIPDFCETVKQANPAFFAPDTVCVNTPVNITNASSGASSYYWSFCSANLSTTTPSATNLGNISGQFATPVFMDFIQSGANWYGFLINYGIGTLKRLDFGTSLLNTPTVTDLGNFGGNIPKGTEGIQVVYDQGNYYAIIVGGSASNGTTPRVLTLDFGANITNTSPIVHNWGNIAGMTLAVDLYVFKDIASGNWYGLSVDAEANSIARFNFTNNLSNTPTGTNLGNVGSLSYPTGIYAVEDNGNWRVFVTNAGTNDRFTGPFSLTRLDFGNSLLNTPTGTNLGSLGGKLQHPRDLTIMKSCGQIVGYVVNGNPSYSDLVKLDFNNNLLSTPSATSLGNMSSWNFPHSISRLFRVNDDLYGFVTDAAANTMTRLRFAGCTNASISGSTLQTPPTFSYNTPGTYNINLTLDDGLATQTSTCKQIVVLPQQVHHAPKTISLCAGDSIKLGAATTTGTFIWNDGVTKTDSLVVKAAGTYWVNESNGYCSNQDTFIVSTVTKPIVSLGNDTAICASTSYVLNAGNPGAIYKWQDGSTGQTFNVNLSGTYSVAVTPAAGGCTVRDTINISYAAKPSTDFSLQLDACNPLSVTFTNIGTSSGVSSWWDFGDGVTQTGPLNTTHTYVNAGNYTVRFALTMTGGCTDTITKSIAVGAQLANIITTNDTTICPGSTKQLLAGPALSYCWAPTTYLNNPNIANPVTSTPVTMTYYLNSQVQGSNIIVNGDFSAGNTGFTSGYNYVANNTTEGEYFVGTNPQAWNANLSNCKDHTTGAGNMLLVNGAPALNVKIWTQTVTVTPNTNYAFSTWIQALYPPNPAQLQFSINGLDIGNPITASLPTCTWTQFYTTWNSGSNTTATISIVNKNTIVQGNDFALDDISFSPILIKRDSVIITVDTPSVKTNNDTTICSGSALQLSATGAVSYSWTPATGLSSSTIANPVATPAAGTRYIVTGINQHGCSAKDTMDITVNPKPQADFGMQLNACNPLQVTLTNIGTVTGVSGWWDFGDGNTQTGVLSTTHIYAVAGAYTVRFALSTATCTDTVTKAITVGAQLANIITTNDTTICPGSTKKMLGVSALSYCWTPSTYLDNPSIATPTTSTPVKMTYYLNAQVQGSNLIVNGDFSAGNTGFTSGYNYVANNTTEGEYYVGTNPQAWNAGLSSCKDHTTGSGNMLLVNGAPTFNVKVWTQTVTVTPNTNYAFSTWIQALFPPNPAQLQFSINGLDIGNPITASLPTCTWTQFYTTWNSGSNTTATISIVNKNTIILGNDFALDDISFSPIIIKRDSVIISVDTPSVKTNNDTTICQGQGVPFSTTGALTYSWTPLPGLSDGAIGNPIASPAATTRYIVTGTNSFGCLAKDTVDVTVNTKPVANFNIQLDPCNPLTVTFNAIGTPPPGNWWSFGDGATQTGASGTAHTYPANGSYTVKYAVSNAFCTDTVSESIAAGAYFADIITTPDTTICTGSSKKLFTVPGTGYCWTPATYLDNPSIGTPTSSTPVKMTYFLHEQIAQTNLLANADFSGGNTGFTSDYTYKTVNSSGTAGAGEYTVTATPTGFNSFYAACTDHTTGSGNMLLVNGSLTAGKKVWAQSVTVTPNTNYVLTWWVQSVNTLTQAKLQMNINNQAVGNPFVAGASNCQWQQCYSIWNSGTATSAAISLVDLSTALNGNDFAIDDLSFTPLAIRRDSVTITLDTPLVKAIKDTMTCIGTPMQLNASGGNTYSWSPATGLSNTGIANPVATPATTTKYYVSGTDKYGCSAKDSVLLTVNALPVVTHTPDTTICHDKTLQLSASGGTNYSWSPAANLSNAVIANPVASPVRSTLFTVTVTDANKCVSKASITVRVTAAPVFTASGAIEACKGIPVSLSADGGDTYLWQPAAGLDNPQSATPVATPGISTNYQVKIIAAACQDSTLLTVPFTVLDVPAITAQRSNDVDCSVPMANLNATGGLRYLWTPGGSLNDSLSASPVAKPNASTMYHVQGTAANGCAGYDSVLVTVTKAGELLFNIPNAFTPNNDGHNDCFGAGRYAALISSMEINIYNRWGTRLFHSTSVNACWDGTYNGKPQDPGGYPYIIKAKTLCGEVVKKGVLILVR